MHIQNQPSKILCLVAAVKFGSEDPNNKVHWKEQVFFDMFFLVNKALYVKYGYTASVMGSMRFDSHAREARLGQIPIPIDSGQPLFLWLSRD